MAPEPPEVLRGHGRSLEDEFFHREDKRLLAKLADLKATEATREALARASGISKPEVLDKLLALGIKAETVAALSIVPLIEVAWADGSLDTKERQAILDRARNAGVGTGSTGQALLEAWLERRPDPKLLDAWTHMVRGLREQLGPVEAAQLKGGLLDQARAVASASGGILGMGSKVSGAEAAMLARLEAAFVPGS
jgi:hypothetical protein